jgi:hypothetical protein
MKLNYGDTENTKRHREQATKSFVVLTSFIRK